MEYPGCSVVTSVLVVLGAQCLLGCGGGGPNSTSPPPQMNPVPAVEALSPNSSQQGGPLFTLSVVGLNFIASSSIRWNAQTMPTKFVSSSLVTAEIPASAVAAAGPDTVTVVNPAPGGGTSGPLTFTVPCVIASPAPAASQTRARLGAYYFDGWSGPLTNFHFRIAAGSLSGSTACFRLAGQHGLCNGAAARMGPQLRHRFFCIRLVFQPGGHSLGEILDSALQITHALADRHGMQYAILCT